MALVLAIAPALPLHALEWERFGDPDFLGDLSIDWSNTLSAGAAWRLEEPATHLIGKASLPQNRNLCAPDDCLGLSETDTEPNERFLAAPGALSSNADDANLNYQKGDVVAAAAKWSSRLAFNWSNGVGIDLSWLYFFDSVNQGFIESHPNRMVTPGPQPGASVRVPRDPVIEDEVGSNFELRNANISFSLPWFGQQELDLRIGRQQLQWGVASFAIQGSTNVVNPADVNNLARPGGELFEIYRPVSLVKLAAPLFGGLSFETFYQLEWRSAGLPGKGSFLSFFDAGNEPAANESFVLPFAKAPEDPALIGTPANDLLAEVSSTSLSARRAPNREPRDDGQYGAALYYFAENLGNGTEFGAYYANYHNRFPSVSAFATAASCTRREGNARRRDTRNLAEFGEDCGVPNPLTPGKDFAAEALPLDTARIFTDYAEDIRMTGVSVSSEILGMAVQAEVSYRPNQPVQVDLEDVLFAAFQPAFPRNTIVIAPGAATLSDSEDAIPDYLTAYRGGTPGEIAPGQYVRGYERLRQYQATLGFLKVFGPREILGADQSGVLGEFTAISLPDLPALTRLQFEGPGTNTHASPGIADTGNGLLINPIQNRGGYVTDLSYGYRIGALALYENVLLPGLSLRPVVVWIHDLEGVAPGLGENFLQGRKIALLNLEAKHSRWTFNVQSALFAGAGERNTLSDRDLVATALSYDF